MSTPSSQTDGDPIKVRLGHTVLLFPLAARLEKVGTVAENLARKHGWSAQAYLKQTLTVIEKQLDGLGIDEEVVARELSSFRAAVERKLIASGRLDFKRTIGGKPWQTQTRAN